MRLNDFPLWVEADGVIYGPAMLAAFDEVTQLWAHVDGEARVVASGPALIERDASVRGLRMTNGRKVQWQALLADGTAWQVRAHPHCCSCNRHPLCGFVPPEPAALSDEVSA